MTMTTVRSRTRHPGLSRPEFARVYWHHGPYIQRKLREIASEEIGQ